MITIEQFGLSREVVSKYSQQIKPMIIRKPRPKMPDSERRLRRAVYDKKRFIKLIRNGLTAHGTPRKLKSKLCPTFQKS